MHEIQTIEIFSLSTKPVASQANIRVCLMDKIGLLDKTFNERLNLAKVKDIWSAFRREYEQAFTCQLKAMEYQLAYLPAIVINNRAVIYGVDNLPQALAIWEKSHG